MLQWPKKILLSAFVLVAINALPARAEEFRYSPEGCEFSMTFPSEPHAIRRCHDKMPDKCTLMTGYTQVFDLDTTVNFYVACKPSEKDMRKDFTADIMRTSLLARPYVNTLEVYDVALSETDEAFMGALFGAGPSPNGNDVMVYVTQLWVGKDSVLALEGELIGKQTEQADILFASVLRSMRHKSWAEGENPAPAAKPAEEPPAQQEKPAATDSKTPEKAP